MRGVFLSVPIAAFDLDGFKRAMEHASSLEPEEQQIAHTFLVSEAILAGLYYVLLAAVVFFLGRRIIQAMVAGYREAKAQSV
ncbi:MAG: hypothetical protein AAGI46_12580 [Planctomycetota bacterium]